MRAMSITCHLSRLPKAARLWPVMVNSKCPALPSGSAAAVDFVPAVFRVPRIAESLLLCLTHLACGLDNMVRLPAVLKI